MERIKILLADDHEVVLLGLRTVLEGQPDMSVVGEAKTGRETVAVASKCRPDVVILDLRLPDLDGATICRALLDQLPETRILVLTAYPEEKAILAALAAGARGFLLKDAGSAHLLEALRTVAAGGVAMDPASLHRTCGWVQPPQEDAALTPREREILQLLAEGKRNRDIARELFLSEYTIRNHISEILTKLRLGNRTQAALFAARLGLTAGAGRG